MINRVMVKKLKRIVDRPWEMDYYIDDVRMESQLMETQILRVLGNNGMLNRTFCARPTHETILNDDGTAKFRSIMEFGIITGRHTMIRIGKIIRVNDDTITIVTPEGDEVDICLRKSAE